MITSKPTKPVHIKVCVPPIRVPKRPAKKANIIDDSENVIHLPFIFNSNHINTKIQYL